MNILAIDASTKASGIAVFQDKKLIYYTCITAGSTNLFARIDKMIVGIEEIILKYKINYVYIESVYPEDVHNNQSVFDALKYLQGFILHLLNKYNIKHTFLGASEWRSKCGIHTGRGIKREILKAKDIQFVQQQFGIKVNDDIADAICIGCAGLGLSSIIKTEDGFEFS